MLLVVTQLATIFSAALALCAYAGWGAARLALPESLRDQRALFVPLAGYAIAIWLGYIGVSSALNLRWSLALLLALASALNLLAWRRTGRPRPIMALRAHAAPLALCAATLLAGVLPLLRYGYLTAIGQGWDTESYLPLAQHLTDYALAQIPSAPVSPLRDLASDPPRIGVTLGFPVFQGMTMLLSGQSALATFAPLLALLRALGILAIYAWLRSTMGLGRAAALLGAALASAGSLMLWIEYFNFGMQLAAWPLLALGLAIGLATVEQLAAPTNDGSKQETGRPGEQEIRSSASISRSPGLLVSWSRLGLALLGAIVLAALPVAYYPALTLWLPVAAGLGLARVLESLRRPPGRPGPIALLLAALALGLATLLLAAPTIVDYFQGFSFRYSLIAQHIGPDRFIAFAETLGLLAFRLPNDGPQPPATLVWIATALAGLFGLAGLALGSGDRETRRAGDQESGRLGDRETGRPGDKQVTDMQHRSSSPLLPFSWSGFTGLALGSGGRETRRAGDQESGRPGERETSKEFSQSPKLLVSWSGTRLRWLGLLLAALAYLLWLRFVRPYEYAYMKGSAYAGFVAWGLVAAGAQALWRRAKPPARPLVAGLALVPLLVAGWAQGITIGDHWRGPAIFTRDIAAVDQAAALVPDGATVAISSDPSFTGPNSGLLSAAFYGRELWGHFSTAYAGLSYWPQGRMPQYALLAAGERAWPLELGGRELWRSGAAALYQLDQQSQTLLGRADWYSRTTVDKFSPASLDMQRRGGPYRAATPAAPLTLLVGATLGFGPGQPAGGAGAMPLRLTVATLADQAVAVSANGATTRLVLKAGVNQIALVVQAPAQLTLAPEQPLALIDATTANASSAATPTASQDQRQIAWSALAEQQGDRIRLRVPIVNPGRHALRIGFTIVEDTFDRPNTLAQLLAAAPANGVWQLNLDLARGASEALVDATPTPMLRADTAPSPPDGRYFGVLALYDGEQVVAHAPVFTLTTAAGKLATLAPIPFTVEASRAGQPATPLPGNQRWLLHDTPRRLDSRQAELAGAILERAPALPGAPGDAPSAPGTPLSIQLFWQALAPGGRPLMVSLQALGPDNRKWTQWDGALGGDWRPIQSWQAGERVRQDIPLQLDPATPPGAYRLALVVYDPAGGQAQPFGGEAIVQLGELQVQ